MGFFQHTLKNWTYKLRQKNCDFIFVYQSIKFIHSMQSSCVVEWGWAGHSRLFQSWRMKTGCPSYYSHVHEKGLYLDIQANWWHPMKKVRYCGCECAQRPDRPSSQGLGRRQGLFVCTHCSRTRVQNRRLFRWKNVVPPDEEANSKTEPRYKSIWKLRGCFACCSSHKTKGM